MRILLAVLALLLSPAAFAHGGEDHGGEESARSFPASASRVPSAGGIGETFEVLVKAEPVARGLPQPLRAFVADARTNAPIEGAAVELTLVGASEIKVKARANASAGVYDAEVRVPSEGDYHVVAQVSRERVVDLVTLGKLQVRTLASSEATPSATSPLPLILGGLILAGALALGVASLMRRKGTP